MMLNLLTLNDVRANYNGEFNNVLTDINFAATNTSIEVLDVKNKFMSKFSDELKSILRSRFNNDIEAFAESLGLTTDQVSNLLLIGASESPSDSARIAENVSGDNIQIGDKIEINTGDGNNDFSGILNETIKSQKNKIAYLEDLLKEKDEVIATQKEMILLMKKK